MQEGQFTEPALMIICKDILQECGTLPVGEIGKMLQEQTNIPQLSSKLKERFGGLKKFLEMFSNDFVLSTDHPFNPHVFIRKYLTTEDMDTLSKGVVPPQFSSKYKKVCSL